MVAAWVAWRMLRVQPRVAQITPRAVVAERCPIGAFISTLAVCAPRMTDRPAAGPATIPRAPSGLSLGALGLVSERGALRRHNVADR